MNDFKSLDDIFNDADFDELIKDVAPKKVEKIDSEIEKFLEIVEWSKKHQGKEPIKSKDMKERSLASRLGGIKKNPEKMAKLKNYDEFNWFDDVSIAENITVDLTLDDILADDLFNDTEKEKSLFDVSRYKRTVSARDKMSVRKKIGSNFDIYDKMFNKVHAEIAIGERQMIDFKGNQLRTGQYYIYNKTLTFLYKIFNSKTGEELHEYDRNPFQRGQNDYKVHVIYENGTENKNMLAESLISSLYEKNRNGKIITEPISDNDLLGHTTGYIYVVKYAGMVEKLLSYENLYKVGYTSNVKKRLSNTINEATYLYAPVMLMAEFEVQNINAKKVEKYLHDVFANKRLQIDMVATNGKKIDATEWYIISLEKIQSEINQMITKLLIL